MLPQESLLRKEIADIRRRLEMLESLEYVAEAGRAAEADHAADADEAVTAGDADTVDGLHAATSGADAHVLATDRKSGG